MFRGNFEYEVEFIKQSHATNRCLDAIGGLPANNIQVSCIHYVIGESLEYESVLQDARGSRSFASEAAARLAGQVIGETRLTDPNHHAMVQSLVANGIYTGHRYIDTICLNGLEAR